MGLVSRNECVIEQSLVTCPHITHTGDRTNSLLGDKRAVSSGSVIPQDEGYTETPPEPRMEESFTIHLGKDSCFILHCRMMV